MSNLCSVPLNLPQISPVTEMNDDPLCGNPQSSWDDYRDIPGMNKLQAGEGSPVDKNRFPSVYMFTLSTEGNSGRRSVGIMPVRT